MKRLSSRIVLTQQQILQLHNHFSVSVSLIGKENTNHQYEELHGFGVYQLFNAQTSQFNTIKAASKTSDWIIGILSYELKNEIFGLTSNNQSSIATPITLLLQPKFVISKKNSWYQLHCEPADKEEFLDILNDLDSYQLEDDLPQISLNPTITKDEYAEGFATIQSHIQQGNCYELNYCQQFEQTDIQLNAVQLFKRIVETIDAPFTAFFQYKTICLISASPERYIQINDDTIVSQPIKGTSKRGNTQKEDEESIQRLQENEKEATENIMIVDLVRNDLGRCCVPGTVEVTELNKIHTFSTVHQLISTVQGKLLPTIQLEEIIEKTFPMGSMTGAPKRKVLEIIDEVEQFKRGWYSGSIGYIEPNGNADFNVIIRSFIYDKTQNLLTYGVGSAITAAATMQDEYDECFIKVDSLITLLNKKTTL